MQVILNPGTGPVTNATEANATENIKHFLADVGIPNINWMRAPKMDYGEGRYAFLLWKGNQCSEVQMPGLPLERVRFMENEGQNIFDFPRLYVDNGSWIWCIAIDCVFADED